MDHETHARAPRLSPDGTFANGVTAAAVIQFILDHDAAASIEDVAAWFELDEHAVVAALGYYAVEGDRLRVSGEVTPP